ncbi:hypothetical protein, partial [Okeania sp. SIO2B3]|uniref:hypothetical protein n=1 Tax=Okeania sp. SIO2B3 TaxID=2607784 RepID=UPI0013BEBF1A|nr:hypothetical protein [Okeania sp. SIO2B3]
NKVVEGGKALIESIQKGTFGKIFKQWAKDDPLAAAAGTIATGLAAGVLLVVGGTAVGWVVGGIGSAISGLGVGGGLLAGTTLGGLASGILTTERDRRLLREMKRHRLCVKDVENFLSKKLEFHVRPFIEMEENDF